MRGMALFLERLHQYTYSGAGMKAGPDGTSIDESQYQYGPPVIPGDCNSLRNLKSD